MCYELVKAFLNCYIILLFFGFINGFENINKTKKQKNINVLTLLDVCSFIKIVFFK